MAVGGQQSLVQRLISSTITEVIRRELHRSIGEWSRSRVHQPLTFNEGYESYQAPELPRHLIVWQCTPSSGSIE